MDTEDVIGEFVPHNIIHIRGDAQVPSPGRYDPKPDVNVKGAIMPTSKRFPGQSTTSSSLDNIEKASTASLGVVFRTPQLMRKVPLTPRLQYLKEKNIDTSGSDILSSEERTTMKYSLKKTVSKADYKRLEDEFNTLTMKYHKMMLDKDMEVNILKEEISEIKIHEAELKDFLEEKVQLAADRFKETLELKDNLDTMVEKISADREEHQKFINDLRSQISELQNNKYELETVLAEKQSIIVTINDKYSDLENELKSLEEENMILEQANSCLLMGADEKLQQLENEITSKLQSVSKSLEAQIEERQIASVTKMNYVVHEFNKKSKEIIDQVKQSQEKVKGLERLVDRKVKEFSTDIKEADERCKYLYRELCKVEEHREELLATDLEKKITIIEIQAKSDLYQSELKECRNTCRKYQITLNTMNETITALSNRLLESEQEVERLNGVVNDLESQNQLLEEKSQILSANNVALKESMDKMEEEIIQDVSAMKESLAEKTEIFKQAALQNEKLLENKISEKQCAINLLLQENEYFKTELERKDELIEGLKKTEQKYQENICKLKSERSKLEDEVREKLSDNINKAENILELNLSLDSFKEEMEFLKTKISCLEAEKNSLQNVLEESKYKISNYEDVMQEKQFKINALEDEVVSKDALCQDLFSQLDSLSSSYNKQNEEMKRNAEEAMKLVVAEDQISDLEMQLIEKDKELERLRTNNMEVTLHLDEVQTLRDQLEELQQKYEVVVEERDRINHEIGDLMGHQNIRQKIKKVSELKQYNSELETECELLRRENLKLKTKMESLKKKTEDKENLSIIQRDDKQKLSKPGSTKKKPMSPSVLKPSNY